MTLVIDDLQILDYDLFGKCTDMISFISNRSPIQITQPQIKAVAKLTNQLIQILKNQEAWKFLNQSENEEIIFILKNNFKKIQKEKQDLEAKNYELNNQRDEFLRQIQELTKDRDSEKNQKYKLSQENQAKYDFIQQLEETKDELQKQFENQNNQLIEHNEQLQNEVNQLNVILNFRNQKIQNQEGEITNLQQNLNQLLNDQNQDQNHDLFNKFEGIFEENQNLMDQLRFAIQNSKDFFHRFNIEDEEQQPQNEKLENQEFIQELKKCQKNFLDNFHSFSAINKWLFYVFGAYVILKLTQ